MAGRRRKKKRAMELQDCEQDIYSHLQMSAADDHSFSSLLQEFSIVLEDAEVNMFMDLLHGIAKTHVLHLHEESSTEEEEEEDPKYKFFLENLRADGKSYVLDIPENNVLVKYHHDEPESSATTTTSETPHVSEIDHDEANVDLGKEVHAKNKGMRRKQKTSRNLAASQAQNHGGNNGRKRRRGRPRKHGLNEKGKDQIIDHADIPSAILKQVKVEPQDYDHYDYDDDDDDDALLIIRTVQAPVLNVEYDWCDNQANARRLTDYRERLMEELKMPYREDEYERLMKDITDRKPVQHHKDLRGGIIIYEEDYLGKSLLDHHIDLSRKIDQVRDDRPRVLNLMRGFFYWLKNLSNEGAFQPWTDPCCLDVLPQP